MIKVLYRQIRAFATALGREMGKQPTNSIRSLGRGLLTFAVFLICFGFLIWMGSFGDSVARLILWGLIIAMSIAALVLIWRGRTPNQGSVLSKRILRWVLDEPDPGEDKEGD